MKLLAALLVVTAAGSAWADVPTKVFPLTGHRLPKAISKSPEVLSRALAKSAGGEVTTMRIEDLADCDLDTDPCLESVMTAVHAKRIVYGSIVNRPEGGVIVRLTWFDGSASEQKIVLTGDSPEALAEQLVYGLTEGAKASPPKTKPTVKTVRDRPEPEPGTEPETEPLLPGLDKDPAKDGGHPTTLTIGLIGGGAAVALVGAGFLVSANGLKGEVERAPTNTYDDLQYLQSLERAGRLRTGIGAALMVGGAACSAVGVWRLLTERQDHARGERAVHVIPERGGASVMLTMGWP